MKHTLAATALIGASLFAPTPATAATPPDARVNNDLRCYGQMASTRQDNWGQDFSYHVFGQRFRQRQSASLRYMFCPNNPPGPYDYTNLVMPMQIRYCVTPIGNPAGAYRGVTEDPNIYDADNHDTNPAPYRIRTRSDNQVCRWQVIHPRRRDWMTMSATPRWSVFNEINLGWTVNDQGSWFRHNNHTVKPIVPGNDLVIRPLHRIPDYR